MTPAEKQEQIKSLKAAIPLIEVVFADIKAEYFEAWERSDAIDDQQRYWHKNAVLNDVKNDLLDKLQGEGLNYE